MATLDDLRGGNYSELVTKLDDFIRRYYLDKVIRGTIYTFSFLLGAYLVFALAEYLLFLPSVARAVLFYGLIAAALVSFSGWIFLPLARYYHFTKTISYEEAAKFIGKHFKEVDDRLLNILQLREQAATNALAQAGLNQKIAKVKNVPFGGAVNIKLNRRYAVRYLLPVFGVLLLIVITAPRVLTESSRRLIQYDKVFEKEAPFKFKVLNDKLQAVQYSNYTVEVEVNGDVLPQDAFLNAGDVQYKMERKGKNKFRYTFANVLKSVEFQLAANGFSSQPYELEVIPKPSLTKFSIEARYPKYIGKQDETFRNTGDISVPEGTELVWKFSTSGASGITLKSNDETIETKSSGNIFSALRKVKQDWQYQVKLNNDKYNISDSVAYQISVVPDQNPSISVEKFEDTTQTKIQYFAGTVSDDYGLRKLDFHYNVKSSDGSTKAFAKPISVNGKDDNFNYVFDLTQFDVKPGETLEYFFEVWDNDGVNGSKSTRSAVMTYTLPTLEEMEKQSDENSKELQENLSKSLKELKDLNKQLEQEKKDLLQKKNLNWEDTKKLNDLLEQQKKLMDQIKQMQQQYQQNNEQKKDFQKPNEQLEQKQEQLEKLAQEMQSPELQDLMKKIQELLEKQNKDQLLQQLEQNQQKTESMEKQLERLESLYKQLQFEEKFEQIQDKLEELAKKQDDVQKETESQDKKDAKSPEAKEELEKKQDDIAKEFDKIQEELKELEEMNKDLEQPMGLPDMKDKEQNADKELEKSKEQLSKGNNSKASESQKGASKEMKEMAEAMEQMMEGAEMQQMEQDMKAIRQILENLVTASFKQEDIIDRTKAANIQNPSYLKIIQDQKRLQDDLKMVEDSMQALAKRNFQIAGFVNDEIEKINTNIGGTTKNLVDRRPQMAASNQQFIMTSLNNLALIFDEQMQQMQQQMSGKMAGSQMCNKPGGSGESVGGLMKKQKQLSDKITDKQGGKKPGEKPGEKPGNKPGQGKPGEQGGPGQQGGQGGSEGFSSEDLARMAAEQAAIRNALKELSDKINKDGKNSLGLDQIEKLMDMNERDLVNRQITNETLKRQNEIITRLLESEKAERERDQDEKRQAEQGKDQTPPLPPNVEEYLKKRRAELELYKTLPPQLRPFYKNLVQDYYNKIPQ